ncbi:MAG: DMT family transporter [Alkaliphilus sp.]|nr:DMT family transporter [Alkaliphilus sp.]
MKKYKIWMMLTACNLFWAGNYVFGKYLVNEMTPLWITFSRWSVASLLLLGIACIFEKPNWSVVIKHWRMYIAMGLLGLVGYNTVLYSALDYTSSTNAALVSALNPGVIVLFSVFLLKERLTRLQLGGMALSLLGVLVILTGGKLTQLLAMDFNRGDLLMIVAVLLWTGYSLLAKRIKEVPPITLTAMSALFATFILAPFALDEGIRIQDISSLATMGIVYIIIFPSVGSFVFWNISVRQIGASQAGIFLNLIPVFTAIISWSLGEKISSFQILGGILVFSGVYLTTGMLDQVMLRKGKQSKVAI